MSMQSAAELQERFVRILGTTVEEDEVVESLFETDWIRILVTRTTDEPDCVQLEVELAIPACIIDSLRNEVPSSIPGCRTARAFVEMTIAHLRYLIRLEEVGLELSVAPNDGIWSASTTVESTPPIPFFAELLPPTL